MSFTHIAALALVGWYLLLPPTTPPNGPSLNAPLSQWAWKWFGTQDECKTELANRIAAIGVRFTEEVKLGRCISTDDPRLKEK